MSMFTPRPSFPSKPSPDQPKPPGLFGQGGYGSWDDMKGFARRFPWEKSVVPGTGRQLGEQERVNLIEELRKRDPSSGGLSEQGFRERILPQLKREISQLDAAGKINEKIELGRKIEMYEKLIKGE